ncbi:hypothetical protein FRB91_001465 [Serendipita sp. 411]|nr:hypothetical protein FRB91_001465 [Serendipita sp. 411]
MATKESSVSSKDDHQKVGSSTDSPQTYTAPTLEAAHHHHHHGAGAVGAAGAGTAAAKDLDISLALPGMTGVHEEDDLDPYESKRVKRKIDWRVMPLLCAIYTLQFLDKNAIGAATILGFLKDNQLTTAQLNNLGTFFYVGLLASQIPHSYAFQKFPVAKYLAVMMFLWAMLVGVHCAAIGYKKLIALRILLGFTEGCITPGIMLVTSMFYTRTEMGERVGWTFQCNGIAQILSGFIAFGAFHTPTHTPLSLPQNHGKVAQWQWFMVIISLLTFVVCLAFAAFFPDSPTKAGFLTQQDKIVAIKRIRANQSGVETKKWKKYQFFEAVKDPKAWIFMLFAVLANFVGGIGIQYSLIIKDMGFSVLETTLLNIPSGGCMVITVTFAMWMLHRYPNARGWISVLSYIPSIISVILLITLPDNRIGLLVAFYCIQLGNTPAVVLSLSWITTTTSGHTKKLTQHAMWLIGYSVGQMVAPQWWKDKYKPRNRVPWAIILTSYCCQVVIILSLRWYLNQRNVTRDKAAAAATTEEEKEKYSEYGWIEVPVDSTTIANANGKGDGASTAGDSQDEMVVVGEKEKEKASASTPAPAPGMKRVRVEKRFLDLTDFENLSFRYVL